MSPDTTDTSYCGLPGRWLCLPLLLGLVGVGLFVVDRRPSCPPVAYRQEAMICPTCPHHTGCNYTECMICPTCPHPCNRTECRILASIHEDRKKISTEDRSLHIPPIPPIPPISTVSPVSSVELSRVIVLFFATGVSGMLCNVLEMALEWGVTVRVIGMDPAGSHFDVKTDRIVNGVEIVARTLGSDQERNQTLFVALDWDVILQCNEMEWLDVFHRAVPIKARHTSLLFSGEKNIFPQEWLLYYPPVGNRDAYQMPFLNSGAYMGTVEAFRRAGARYRLYPNPENKYIDQHIWQNMLVDYTVRTGMLRTDPRRGPGYDVDANGRSLKDVILVDASGRMAFSMCPVPVVEPKNGGIVSGVHVIEHRIDNSEAFRFSVDAPFHHVVQLFNFEWQWDILRVNESTGHVVAEISRATEISSTGHVVAEISRATEISSTGHVVAQVSPPQISFRPCILHFNGRAKGDDGKRGRNPRSYQELVELRRSRFYHNLGISPSTLKTLTADSVSIPRGVWHEKNLVSTVQAYHSSGQPAADFIARLITVCKENGPQ